MRKLDEQLFTEIVKYLSQRPLGEVLHLWNALGKVEKIDEEDSKPDIAAVPD